MPGYTGRQEPVIGRWWLWQWFKKAYIYNKDSNTWRAVSDMTRSRKYHSCGLVKSDSGDEVVVVGGYGAPRSVEIFSISTETWRSGNEMAFEIIGANDIR